MIFKKLRLQVSVWVCVGALNTSAWAINPDLQVRVDSAITEYALKQGRIDAPHSRRDVRVNQILNANTALQQELRRLPIREQRAVRHYVVQVLRQLEGIELQPLQPFQPQSQPQLNIREEIRKVKSIYRQNIPTASIVSNTFAGALLELGWPSPMLDLKENQKEVLFRFFLKEALEKNVNSTYMLIHYFSDRLRGHSAISEIEFTRNVILADAAFALGVLKGLFLAPKDWTERQKKIEEKLQDFPILAADHAEAKKLYQQSHNRIESSRKRGDAVSGSTPRKRQRHG